MAVKIRLQRKGAPNRPFYRIVVTDERRANRGKVIAILGQYSHLMKPSLSNVKEEEIVAWCKKGAKLTPTLAKLLRHAGIKVA